MAKKNPDEQPPPPSHPGPNTDSSQARLRLFRESVKDFAIVMLEPEGRVAEWNAAAEGIFGYTETEVIDRPFALFFSPEEKGRAENELQKAAADGQAESEGWQVRKDGTRFWASGFTTALRDENGKLIGFGRVVRDLTQNKEMEDHLRRVEERFRLFMENVKEYAVFMLDPQGRVVDWNLGAEHLLGYGDEILGQPFSVFFPPEDRKNGDAEAELREAVETGRASDDRWHVRKDGTYFWALGITTAMRDEDGSLKGFTKVLRDSTERKRFEEELQKRNKALEEADLRKDEFLAVLAHELRNSLAPVFNALSILDQENLPGEARAQTRLLIGRQVRHLAHLVDDLLDVSRIGRGKLQLKKKPVDLGVILDHAVQACRSLIQSHKHELAVSLPPDPIRLEADQNRLVQVMVNLLNNAAKYSEDGSRIAVTASLEGGEAVLRVRDTGVGIPPELLPNVFDLFRQSDRTLDRSQGGLGIGLTLVRRLVELHDGKVEARSEGIGKGSEFIVRLPLPEELSWGTPPEDTGRASQPGQNPLRVLIVEDNVDAAESLRMVLAMGGHQVQAVHGGAAALKAAQDHRPEVILLDIGLPDLNGYQVAERLREAPGLKDAVLVAMTGYGQEEDRQRSRQAGFHYHLVKPVDPQQLQQLLTMLGKKKG